MMHSLRHRYTLQLRLGIFYGITLQLHATLYSIWSVIYLTVSTILQKIREKRNPAFHIQWLIRASLLMLALCGTGAKPANYNI